MTSKKPLTLLHSSDWHIGRTLYGRKRSAEHAAFFDWLLATIEEQQVDVLLVAGDLFDTTAPSNRAQQLYYRFLCRVAASCCRHVVVIAGNHDSPSFLNAPRELLKALHVHVIGDACDDPADEVLLLADEEGRPELLVCAVPYLRDRNIRQAEAGEGIEEKERKQLEGVRAHYAAVAEIAQRRRAQLSVEIPIVAMGHLFTAGGKTVDGDGVRELAIGSLSHVPASIFPPCFNYLALGHLHVPQIVNGCQTMRYSGSPLPMGFGEARQQKSVCLVALCGVAATVQLLAVPVLQKLVRITGDWSVIEQRILDLSATASPLWLEIIYTGDELIGDLRERLDSLISGTQMDILRVKNSRIVERVLLQIRDEETLDDLSVDDVFERCLTAHQIAEEQRPELRQAYRETLSFLLEDDGPAYEGER